MLTDLFDSLPIAGVFFAFAITALVLYEVGFPSPAPRME